MDIPFDGFNVKMMIEMVANWGERPKLQDSWPADLQTLMKNCWDANRRRRLPFSKVVDSLQQEIAKLSPTQE